MILAKLKYRVVCTHEGTEHVAEVFAYDVFGAVSAASEVLKLVLLSANSAILMSVKVVPSVSMYTLTYYDYKLDTIRDYYGVQAASIFMAHEFTAARFDEEEEHYELVKAFREDTDT